MQVIELLYEHSKIIAMKEVWKEIEYSNGRYKISNMGRVMSEGLDARGHNRKGKILKPKDDGWGYLHVGIRIKGKTVNRKIHVLVADAFIGKRLNDMQIDHINGNKKDNCVSNLRIVTRYENYKNEITYKRHPHKERAVIKMDLLGNVLCQYNSINEAARLNNGSAGNIWATCNGMYKTYHGFKWVFK